ncbi:putative Macro domain-containing protein [Azospirillaceae bacterium]
MLKYIKGDLFKNIDKNGKSKNKYIFHVCNNIGKWGAGFTKDLTKFSKEPEERYREFYNKFSTWPDSRKFLLGKINVVPLSEELIIINAIAQNGVRTPANKIPIKYTALVDTMRAAKAIAKPDSEFHCPKFGSDLAGGDWDFIETLIKETWCTHVNNVYIYSK